jgi:catechol 2,3-dioxygenase-like lactoylglutathione lyase family enzyme
VITGLSELTLAARDPDALARFYSGCFGLRAISREDDRVWHFAFTVEPGGLERIERGRTVRALED